MHYTHALIVELDSMPEGYYPLGNYETLMALYEEANDQTVSLYELVKEPDFTKNNITGEMIRSGIKEVVTGEKDLEISTGKITSTAKSIFSSGRSTVISVKALAGSTIRNRKLPTMIEALPLAAVAAPAINESLRAFDTAKRMSEDIFIHRATDDFIRNADGIFVSKEWLQNPNNATRSLVIKPKEKPSKPKPSIS